MPSHADLDQLLAAAADLDAHAGNLVAAHTAADAAAECALGGWAGRSRVAIAETAERWAGLTTAVAARLDGHAQGLRTSARSYAAGDEAGAQVLARIRW